MAINQNFKERRTLTLPTTGLSAGDKYHLSVGGGKYLTYIVSDSLQLTKEAGSEFIEVDTVAQIRALDARQIWAIENGYYKGVKLNGYYTKGDTPAPIEYILSDTVGTDNGGSILQVGTIKLEHVFKGYIHTSYFGVIEGEAEDNTDRYNTIIEVAEPYTVIEWHTNRVYRGSFLSDKAFTLLGGYSTFMNAGNTRIVGFNREVQSNYTTVIGNVDYSTTVIPVVNATGINPNDLITLRDTFARPADGLLINYETLLVKSVDYVANTIEVADMVRSSQTHGTVTVDLISNPIQDAHVSNFKFLSDDTHSGGGSMQLSFFGCRNFTANFIETSNNVGNAVGVRYSQGFRLENIVHNEPRLNGSGEGYGVTLNYSRDAYIFNVSGFKMRHVIDFASVYTAEVDTVRDVESHLPIQIAHNICGGNIIIRNITVDGQSHSAVHVQNQNLTDPNLHIFRDLKIENVTHVMRTPTSNYKSIRLEGSVYNVDINGVTVINKIPDYNINNIDDCIVGLDSCSFVGNVTINNIYADKLASAVRHSAGTAVLPRVGLLDINNVRMGQCSNGFNLVSSNRVRLNNARLVGAINAGGSLINIGVGNLLNEVYLGDGIICSGSIPVFNIDPPNILIGQGLNMPIANNTAINASIPMVFTRPDLDWRTIIRVTRAVASSINLTDPKVLPDPQFNGEEISILVNNFSDFGTLGGITIPSSNTNIINPEGGNGITIRSGELVRFKGTSIGGAKVWIAERFNKTASTTTEGLIKQTVFTPNADINPLPAVDNPSTATTVEELLDDFNDLLSKYNEMRQYVNENRTRLNVKLANDRTSGQDANS